MGFTFKEGKGLYMDEHFVVDFEPILRCVLCHTPQDVSEASWQEYGIEIRRQDGTMSGLQYVRKLNPDYFITWGVPDALLDRKVRKKLTAKLQMEYESAEKIQICDADKTGPIDETGKSFLFGDLLLGEQKKIEIKSSVIPCKTGVVKHDISQSATMGQQFIRFLPGVSEVLFYSSLMGIVKPYFSMAGFPVRFSIFLYGPSGHLKTSIIRKYALWLDEEKQMQLFQSSYTMRSLEKRIESLKGMNFLFDDYREANGATSKDRQRNTVDNIVRWIDVMEKNANLFMTGEFLEGSFSCQDRTLGIEISKMSSEELQDLKLNFSLLKKEDMISIAVSFAECMAKNSDDVIKEIKTFMCSAGATKETQTGDLRLENSLLCIMATEMLYRKYVCLGDETISGFPELRSAVANIGKKQRDRLHAIRKTGNQIDYVQWVAKAINNGNLATDIENYSMDVTGSVLVKDDCAVITSGNLKYLLQQKFPDRTIHMKQIIQALDEMDALESDKDKLTKKILGRRHYFIRISVLHSSLITEK